MTPSRCHEEPPSSPVSRRDDRQHHARAVRGVQMHGVVRVDVVSVPSHRLAGVWVDVIPREVAARDVDSDAMTDVEEIARWRQFYLDLVELPRRHQFFVIEAVAE